MTMEKRRHGLLRNRDYLLWWVGNLASNIGNQLVLIAFPLLVLMMTGSAAQAGLVASLEALPYLVLAFPVGFLVDRVPRRKLMVWASAVSAAAFASIPAAYAAGDLHIVQVYLVALVNGCATVVFAVSQQSALSHVVDDAHLSQAVGQAETVERFAAVLGPVIAAWLFESVWPASPFALNAFSFVGIAIAVLAIRHNLGPDDASERGTDQGILAGVKGILHYPLLRDLTLINSAGDMLFAGIGLLMILLVREQGGSGASIGFVFSMAAVGGMIGSLVTHMIERRLGVATAVIGKHILTALMFPLFMLDLPPLVVGALWAVISFQVSIVAVIQRKYLLAMTPDNILGKTSSVATFLSFGSLPVGTALTGFSLETFGTHGTVLAYTSVLALIATATVTSSAIRSANEPAAA